MTISEIQIMPIKPNYGLVAFASCVIDDWLYLGSIGIYTKLEGGFRLTYPTKIVSNQPVNLFHPINKYAGDFVKKHIVSEYEEVMRKSNDRYHSINA